jgi:hypothetical protein
MRRGCRDLTFANFDHFGPLRSFFGNGFPMQRRPIGDRRLGNKVKAIRSDSMSRFRPITQSGRFLAFFDRSWVHAELAPFYRRLASPRLIRRSSGRSRTLQKTSWVLSSRYPSLPRRVLTRPRPIRDVLAYEKPPNLHRQFCKRLGDLAGTVEKQLRERAQRLLLKGEHVDRLTRRGKIDGELAN